MSDDLYQRDILDLAKAGAVAARLENPERTASLDNPLCGDRTTIDLRLAGDRIAAVGHRTRGCALCQASAALIAGLAVGASVSALKEGAAIIARSLEEGAPDPAPPWDGYRVFAPVRRHPSRVGCVLLPLQALAKALG
jgi:nitrogen fixation NifU-like protein